MISAHRKFIKTKQQLLQEKEEELETCRLEYLAKREKIIRNYGTLILMHSSNNFRPEIVRDSR